MMGERFARRHVAELVGVLIGAALVVSSATPARADAGGGENCGVFLESGLTICAPAGDDLHAAVTAQTGYTIVDGDETDAGRATTVSYLLARLYDNADYGGAYYEVWGSSGCSSAVGVRGVADIGVGWYGRVSSFQGFSSCRVKVWQNTSFTGSSVGFASSSSYVGAVMNDQTRSVQVVY
ncbi:MAG: hypothetical protein CMH36_12990 [Microbacterium sp.]|uniref:Peptidase inhibitor family I36 n=2 Tax=Microbacterium ginsengisoli TaxID=400772 RepID=A0A3C1KEK9_9MICO|nr:hypothetical protein [Microbacterium sp.]MCK9916686.1 hypothetical protein [Microbacteriaceae bacterium K1510]ODU79831.1 MAG: hypothetical protein ABT08_00670 [Microbacterium sp. SCN 71-21]HAN25085.1 hypothetical protein [Microbacterium ginsengisoli]